MYRGSHPTSSADHPPSPPSAAMLAVDMSHLPSVPSRPAPSQHHHLSPFAPYRQTPTAGSPSDFPALNHRHHHHQPHHNQHHPSRDSDAPQTNVQQLPSLRTLLEPELLLDTKLSDAPAAPRPARGPLPHASSVRYGSSSPTLKRRRDFDGYLTHDHQDGNATVARVPPVHRPVFPSVVSDARYSTPGSTHGSRPELSRHGSLGGPPHIEFAVPAYRPSSTASAMSVSSDPTNALASQPQDDTIDIAKPVRRRTEGSSRAPVRSSRCIGQRDIPGEGLCYVYEDGTYCRAVIDGEAVNPSWGITKAGKPRKRLAQACLTCREKKIKCEPGYPKCHQCAKSQRACRGGLHQPGLNNASGETSPSSSSVLFKNQSAELVSPAAGPDKPKNIEEHRDTSRTVEAWNAGSPFKPRTFRPNSVATSRDMSVPSVDSDWSDSLNNVDQDDPRRGSHSDQLALQWEQDPYDADPRLTSQLLDLYFLHAGRATYGMFPRTPFLAWVQTNHEKNQDHLMLLYAVLAMGSVFAPDADKRAIGKRFAAISAYATEKRFGRFTLQLCQSRLMLALYNFARGRSQEAWDFCGAGLRAISALKLNTEEGIKELPDTTADLDYGFDRRTLEECCRRTFWSGFLMDRYNGFCGGTLCVINIEDTFVSLPCPEDAFEAANPSDAPFFDFELLSRHAPPSPLLGHMAHLTLISAIWGEVLTFCSRAVHWPESSYERLYEAFYAKTWERLETWKTILPAELRYTPQNLDQSIVNGSAGTFISLHALYHTTVIRLNRHVRLRALSAEKISRNIDDSFRSASQFLSMMHSLAPAHRQLRLPQNAATQFLFSTPFAGYALMLSVDVLSSAGTVSTLPDLVETVGTTLACIEELAMFWASARAQQKAITIRVKQLTDIAMQEEQGLRNGTHGQFWRVSDSLETAFGVDDALYKASDEVLYGVVGALTGR